MKFPGISVALIHFCRMIKIRRNNSFFDINDTFIFRIFEDNIYYIFPWQRCYPNGVHCIFFCGNDLRSNQLQIFIIK